MSAQKDVPDAKEATARADQDGETVQTVMLYHIGRNTGWTAFLALVLAVGIAASDYLFWRQLELLQGHLEELQDLSEKVQKSLESGTTQTSALTKTLQDLSNRLARGGEALDKPSAALEGGGSLGQGGPSAGDRPWVGVDSINFGPLQANQKTAFSVNLRNAGRSPALNVRAVFSAATPTVKDIAVPPVEPCATCAEAVLLPNASVSYETALDGGVLTAAKLTRIRNGDDTILLFGRIDYLDSLRRPHMTRVCMVYVAKTSAFSACQQGNQFD